MSNSDAIPALRTPGVIARQLGEPLHRVLYILSTRSHILPSARAGTLRLYDWGAVGLIRDELDAIDSRRSRRSAMAKKAEVITA